MPKKKWQKTNGAERSKTEKITQRCKSLKFGVESLEFEVFDSANFKLSTPNFKL
jgi:hypothetical protein